MEKHTTKRVKTPQDLETAEADGSAGERITRIRRAADVDSGWYIAARKTAQDTRITLEAHGLLGYLLSKPTDWEVRPAEIQRTWDIGRDKCRRLLHELIGAGYMGKEQERNPKGRFSANAYFVQGTPTTENPSTDNPTTEKPSHTKNRVVQSTRKTTPRARDLVFDAVAKHVFKINLDLPIDKQAAVLIGKDSAWLKRNAPDVTEAQIVAFVSWCQDVKGFSAPRDASKFATRWLEFASEASPSEDSQQQFWRGDE